MLTLTLTLTQRNRYAHQANQWKLKHFCSAVCRPQHTAGRGSLSVASQLPGRDTPRDGYVYQMGVVIIEEERQFGG